MAKATDKTEERFSTVEEAISKSEQFFERNQKLIMIIVGVLIILVLGFFGFKRFYLAPKEKEAQGQMFMAEKYFEMDSISRALNGDGNYLGFLAIIDDYGITKTANLAKYYAGICYLKKGNFENAIKYLKKFNGKDEVVGPMATGAIGDAYMELKQVDKAVEYYLKGADQRKNDFTTPYLLMKAGWAYEELQKFDKAKEVYLRIRNDYPRSAEGRDIDKYISHIDGIVKK